jgi:hypothetical protein
MLSAGELLVLAGLVLALYGALRPLRRWLEARIARLLRGGSARRTRRVVILRRRGDGKFGREDGHDG